jgi:hypothetical protein
MLYSWQGKSTIEQLFHTFVYVKMLLSFFEGCIIVVSLVECNIFLTFNEELGHKARRNDIATKHCAFGLINQE